VIPALDSTERFWLMLGLLAGFAVKTPLFPVHTWLPLAHTEAPTAGSVILAGVLLKLGTYGLLRVALPIGLLDVEGVAFPGLLHVIGMLCVIGILYGALVAWVQQDIKKLVAYSSVSHLGFCVLGMIAFNTWGMEGSVLYMINHGLSTGAMFLVIGMIYDRYHTRDINELSGLAKKLPILACFFVFFMLASIGLPGLNGFVSEFLTILGAFTSSELGVRFGTLAALGIILGAIYMLHMTARVIWGPLKAPDLHSAHGHGSHGHGSHGHGSQGHGDSGAEAGGHAAVHDPMNDGVEDLNYREIGLLIPLVLAVLFLGVMPTPLLRSLDAPIEEIRQPVAQAEQAAPSNPTEEAGAVGSVEVAGAR
jgi:NADH-quinone oxidoreductase subunit M